MSFRSTHTAPKAVSASTSGHEAPGMAAALIALRFVHFAAAMAAVGIVAFQLYAFAGVPEKAAEAPARAELDPRLAHITTAASGILLLTALAMVPCVTAQMAGSAAAGF